MLWKARHAAIIISNAIASPNTTTDFYSAADAVSGSQGDIKFIGVCKNLEFKEKEISISSSSSSGRIRDKLNKFGKDFWRPIYGTVVLQPLAVGWALATETTANTFTDIYWSNLGPFTIIATVFLMPAYALYERIYPRS